MDDPRAEGGDLWESEYIDWFLRDNH